jgi:diguanylate cyclase (GGDEF)-like protein
MPSSERLPVFDLPTAARTVARGSGLDAKLDALSGQAGALTAADEVAVLLVDGDADTLVAADGRHVPVGGGPADAGIRRALEERVSVSLEAVPEPLARILGASSATLLVPLVVGDDMGEEVEGLLALGWANGSRRQGLDEQLSALADLVAVAIRQARLQNTLSEQADYADRLAHTDRLTGLANRITFERMLELEIARATRHGTALAIALFDVDGLAELRQQRGGAAGDDVLRLVAATFADRVRLLDTVARISEERFAVIAPADASGAVATRLRDVVGGLPVVDGIGASVSAAVVHHPEDGATGAELIAAAAAILERARAAGPGAVVGTRESAV